MKKIPFVLFLVFITSYNLAQEKLIDSLKLVIKNTSQDSTRINSLLELGKLYSVKSSDSAIYFHKKAIDIALKLKDKVYVGQGILKIGQHYINKNEFDSALIKLKEAKQIYITALNTTKDANTVLRAKKLKADYYTFMGIIQYKSVNNYTLAIKYIDSSQTINKEIKNTKGLTYNYATLGNIYRQNGDNDKALTLLFKGLKLGEAINSKLDQSAIFGNLCLVYENMGNYPLALEYAYKALKIDEELDNKNGMSRHLGNMGMIYRLQGNFTKSLECAFRSLKLAEEQGNKFNCAKILGNIAISFNQQGERNKAKEYYLKALKASEELNDKSGISNQLANLGIVYMQAGDSAKEKNNTTIASKNYSVALDYYFKAIKLNDELNDLNGNAHVYGNIGTVYDQQNNLAKAEEFELKGLQLFEKLDNKQGQAIAEGNIGNLYLKQKKYADAEKHFERSLTLASETGSTNEIKFGHYFLFNLYEKTNQASLALKHYKLFVQYKDSLFNEENNKAIIQQEMKYNYEKKATADSVRVAEEKKVVAIQLKQERTQRYALYSGLSLVVLFAIFMVNRFSVTNRQKKLIETQKLIVEEQKNQWKKNRKRF